MTDDQPAPYPPEHGERARWLPFPVQSPDRTPRERPKVKGDDGIERDHLTGLGVRRSAPDPDDLGVTDWAPWPP